MSTAETTPRGAPRGLLLALAAVGVAYLLVKRDVIERDDLILLGVLIPSVILHEVSHGALALLFGDDTAQKAGRLTLNPIRHVDPFGTLVLPAVLVLAGAQPFGYAKPVPVNPRRLRHPRNHGLLVSLVGPAVNISLAVLAAFVLRNLRLTGEPSTLVLVVFYFGLVNVVLAAFNLIPVPPLDGSAVIERLLPARWWPGYLRIRQYSMFLLLGVVLLLPGALDRVFTPAIRLWQRLL
ncbi:MAG: site-2 protease family protein [Acidimicrobiales bacterium]